MADQNPASGPALELHVLVLRCQAGDERAFAKLMDRFGPRTRRYLRGLVGESADDVQQEVWLTVYRSIAGLGNPSAFRTWLFRTTRHRALDLLRREKRHREIFDDTSLDKTNIADEAAGADDTMDETILAAIDTLSPSHREVCLLRYRDDLSYAEIALVTGCSIGTVRSRLHHAKKTPTGRIRRALTIAASRNSHRENIMTTPHSADGAWALIENEKRRDRFIRRVNIAAWTTTFVLVVLIAVMVGVQVVELTRAGLLGVVPWMTVMASAMPFIDVLWKLSLLVAALSTVGIFLRLRTASLAEIQVRLATLEAMLASQQDVPSPKQGGGTAS